MAMYSAGLRRSEVCRLKVSNIDSQRMLLRVERGKGDVDREVPLSQKLLETFREYWRWMRPQTCSGGPRLTRLDAVVHAEEVCGVVLVFQLHESAIIRPVSPCGGAIGNCSA
jgi:site-specific recombinase XerD